MPCGKRFAKQTTYDAHLSGSRHLRALKQLSRVERVERVVKAERGEVDHEEVRAKRGVVAKEQGEKKGASALERKRSKLRSPKSRISRGN